MWRSARLCASRPWPSRHLLLLQPRTLRWPNLGAEVTFQLKQLTQDMLAHTELQRWPAPLGRRKLSVQTMCCLVD